MKNVYKQKRSEGFTIIEVLIVLAIAALILLIVFLAVPALQRNSRNNGVKNDAANLLAAVNDYVANNGGKLPASGEISGCGTGTVTIGVAPNATSEAKTQGSTACSLVTAGAATPGAFGTIQLAVGYKCAAAGAPVANPRSVAALFKIENSSGGAGAPQCLES